MATTPTRYQIDSRLSRFTVQAFAGGFLSGFGHNPSFAVRDFSGEANFSPDNPQEGTLMLKILAASMEVTNDVSEKDRREIERTMKEEVIQTSQFPEIVYQGSVASASESGEGRYRVNLTGQLNLHGVTHEQAVVADLSLNGETFRAFGNFSVLQSNYGIKPVSVAGGALKVKDELKCSFDIVARQQAVTRTAGEKS